MKKSTYLVIACLVAFLVGGVYYFVKEEAPESPKQAQEASEPAAKPFFTGNAIVEEQDGKRLWELTAETIEIDPNTKQARLVNIKGVFYQDKGGKIEITAPGAVMDTKTKDITMTGNVKAVSSDGATFTANEALWKGKDRMLFGTGGVTLTRDDTVIIGDKLESDANMEKVRVQGNARVIKGGASK